jgi:ketosteroid isomerase-like protein
LIETQQRAPLRDTRLVSRENVELYRRMFKAINGRDEAALIALCDPEIEVRSTFAAVGGAVYCGHEGVRAWQRDLQDSWGGEFRVELEAFFDLGERTLVLGQLRGRGSQSGIEVAMPGTGVARWRGGLCMSHTGYLFKEGALGDLGVSEDALEPTAP